MMKILVINCGSSSVKYKLFSNKNNRLESIASGVVEKIGEEISYFDYESVKGKVSHKKPINDHREAFESVICNIER